jgi:outer membrane protein
MTVILAVIGIAGSAHAADIAKIGIIDAQRILETSSAGKAAQAQIKEKSVRMAEDLKKRGSEVEQLRTQLEREAMVMSQEKREDARREFRIKMNDFKSLEQKYRSELKQLEQKLVGRIQADIIQLTQEIGKQGGYLLIINRPAVLYSPTSIDITDQVIQKYNTKYAKGQTEASSKN